MSDENDTKSKKGMSRVEISDHTRRECLARGYDTPVKIAVLIPTGLYSTSRPTSRFEAATRFLAGKPIKIAACNAILDGMNALPGGIAPTETKSSARRIVKRPSNNANRRQIHVGLVRFETAEFMRVQLEELEKRLELYDAGDHGPMEDWEEAANQPARLHRAKVKITRTFDEDAAMNEMRTFIRKYSSARGTEIKS